MWRTGRALTVLVTSWVAGLSLLLAPAASAEPVRPAAVQVQQVAQQQISPQQLSRQQAEPLPRGYGQPSFSQAPEQQPQSPAQDRQRVTMGVAGIVLIALVLLTRRWRKKSMVPLPKIPKFWK